MDDSGFPPESYRKALISSEGEWDVVVEQEEKRPAVANVARQAFDMSAAEALRFAKKVPGTLWSGTRAEVEWLRRQLTEREIESVAVRRPDGD